MLTKQQWIERVIGSAERVESIQAPKGFEDKVLQQTVSFKLETIVPNKRWQWSIAAGVLLLVALNLLSISHYQNIKIQNAANPSNINAQSFANTYFSYLNDI